MTEIDNILYWLSLKHLDGLGPVAIRKKFTELGNIQNVWQSLEIDPVQRRELTDLSKRELESLQRLQVKVLTLDQPEYPVNLANLADIPPVLYVKGQLLPQDARSIAVVGSRLITRYGADTTTTMVQDLVHNGMTIVSGMARGVDTQAHKAAMKAGGRTIAVWGSGIDKPFPAENAHLAQEIAENGAIITHFPLGVEAQSFTFPARNKLIAGLSLGVLVTEAKTKSGSLLTAEAAHKYQRPVFAIPGPIYSATSGGPHQLIKNGANLVVDVADIVVTLGFGQTAKALSKSTAVDVTIPEKTILDILQSGSMPIDDIIRQSPESPPATLSLITMLEMKGLVVQSGAGEYRQA